MTAAPTTLTTLLATASASGPWPVLTTASATPAFPTATPAVTAAATV